MKQILAIDIETFCDVDLSKCGVYAYSDSPNFEILLFAYSFNNEKTKIVDLRSGEKLPQKVIDALFDENIIKTAFNAAFERICISKYLKTNFSPKSWVCTSVQASMLALPSSLDSVGKFLNIENKKLKEGKELIKYFCMPCKPTVINGYRTRNLPQHAPDKWELFKKYCINDVNAESDIRYKLRKFPISDEEMEIYILDQEINDRGILVDKELVNHAIKCDEKYKEVLSKRAYELTRLNNPNSPIQIKNWLSSRGVYTNNLDRKTVENLLKEYDGEIEDVLKLRLLMSKTSIKKYEAINRSICFDSRVRGLLQFYGAARSGRWAGRLVQVQNLPQNHMKDLEVARNMLRSGKYDDIENLDYSTPDVLSQLIRTTFIPKEGYEFIVADFSSIEARVLAWISNEKWRMDLFENHGKIYEASASVMFNVPIDEITKGSSMRQKGKIAELALGYGGSKGALISMGALEMGLEEKELLSLVHKWRGSNTNITKFWWDIDTAAIKAVKEKREVVLGRISFSYQSGILFITLPCGRKLSYIKPRFKLNQFNKNGLVYEGIGVNKKWGLIETYGPKLVENIVQAISRDLLAESMIRLRDSGFNIVMHVHDEVVVEVEKGKHTVEEVCEIMSINPVWAENLPLGAEGYKCDFYRK
ncbi:MAG: DNA polymerase [Terrisporobacter sp.]